MKYTKWNDNKNWRIKDEQNTIIMGWQFIYSAQNDGACFSHNTGPSLTSVKIYTGKRNDIIRDKWGGPTWDQTILKEEDNRFFINRNDAIAWARKWFKENAWPLVEKTLGVKYMKIPKIEEIA